jgi:hypothetical protein
MCLVEKVALLLMCVLQIQYTTYYSVDVVQPVSDPSRRHRNTRPPKLNLQNLLAIHDDGSCNEERSCDRSRNFNRRKLLLIPFCKLRLKSGYKLPNGLNPRRKLRRKLRRHPGLGRRFSSRLHCRFHPQRRLCLRRAVPLCLDELCTNVHLSRNIITFPLTGPPVPHVDSDLNRIRLGHRT